jgi:hypothetical protein
VTLTVLETPRSENPRDVQGEGPVFIRAEVSRESAYVEEPVIYTVKLYRLVKVSNLSLDIPDRPSLSVRKIGDPLEYRSVINGRQYPVLEVRNEVVASAPGRFTLVPAPWQERVRIRTEAEGFPLKTTSSSVRPPEARDLHEQCVRAPWVSAACRGQACRVRRAPGGVRHGGPARPGGTGCR